jgi:hypothetical protein
MNTMSPQAWMDLVSSTGIIISTFIIIVSSIAALRYLDLKTWKRKK